MRRVVITGSGIVSCLGNDLATVTHALQSGQSGLKFNENYAEKGFKAQVSGSIDHSLLNTATIDRKLTRFFSDAGLYAYISALDALKDANLDLDDISNNPRVGVIAGSGGSSTKDVGNAIMAMTEKGIRGVGAMAVPKTMNSTVSAALATGLKITGVSYSLSSACATSTHCIGHAMEQIQLGKADVILAGGGEGEDWTQSCMFDGMGAMSRKFNDVPTQASRAYDSQRDGFVIAGGGAIVVVESLEYALARNAKIYAEIVGYGATSDGSQMVAPSGEGATRCMVQALKQANLTTVDYINTHGTSTGLGDITELNAIKKAFDTMSEPTKNQLTEIKIPAISSTKSMTGHSLGAVGAQEIIYCLQMMQHDFIAPSINITELDEGAKGFDIVTKTRKQDINTVLSNSFGFGGTNASLVLKKWVD